MELQEGIETALNGEAILFVGAGFSTGALNIRGEKLLRASELAGVLASRAGFPSGLSLEDAAEAFTDRHGDDALISLLQQEFTIQRVQPYHLELAEVPWKRIYTTNYDNVLELAYSKVKKGLAPITLNVSPYKLPKKQTICIHLNGFIQNLDRDTIKTQLKLTEASYLTASIGDSQWATLFRQDIRLAKAVFFVGYSLFDLDIKRILFESISIKDKSFYIIGPTPDIATKRRTERFGNTQLISVEDFANTVRDVRTTFTPEEKEDLGTLTIKEHVSPTETVSLTDKDFINLLMLGSYNEKQVSSSLSTGHRYYLLRSKVDEIFAHIDAGKRVIAISSDLGNGKSLFISGLHIKALERGYRVFELKEQSEESASELEYITKLRDNIFVTLEHYQGRLNEVRQFRLLANDKAVLILAARNSIQDVLIEDVTDAAGVEYIPEVQIDFLSDQEIDWVVDALDEYGLWGELAAKSRREKARFIKDDCKRQFHALLLRFLASPNIEGKLNQLTGQLTYQSDKYQFLLSVFILTVLGETPSLDTLTEIWGPEALNNPSLRKDLVVNEFVDFDRQKVIARSPVAAQYLLSKIADGNMIVATLTKMAKRFDVSSGISHRYRHLLTNLMRFSNLQFVLPEQGKKAAVIKFYESIKNLNSCKRNPHFWLQYAIGCVVTRDLNRADKYFSTAYTLAKDKGWDTYQIDNHFARFLLIQAVDELSDTREAMANFRKARAIVSRQMQTERLHYPYRVAVSYEGFFDKFSLNLSPAELEEVSKAAEEVIQRINRLPESVRKLTQVQHCQIAMEHIVTNAKMTPEENGKASSESSQTQG
jgi:hypothetical protein